MSDRPLLNHVELVYPKGGIDSARAFFETMGFGVGDFGPWLVVLIDPEEGDGINNVLYASEGTPAQQNLEAAITKVIEADAEVQRLLERYREIRRQHPQYTFHFGGSIPTRKEWDARVARLREANESHPLLAGHVEVTVLEPGDPNALGNTPQAFIYTDLVATGPFYLGMVFDMQSRENADTHVPDPTKMVFPDTSGMI